MTPRNSIHLLWITEAMTPRKKTKKKTSILGFPWDLLSGTRLLRVIPTDPIGRSLSTPSPTSGPVRPGPGVMSGLSIAARAVPLVEIGIRLAQPWLVSAESNHSRVHEVQEFVYPYPFHTK